MQMKATLYYRNKLDEHDRKIYDDLVSKWMRFDKNITIGVPHCGFADLTQAVHFDYPLLFYINYYQIAYGRSIFGLHIRGDYLYGKEEAKEMLDRCEQWGNYILKNLSAGGEAEKALWLHDVILNNVRYSEENGIRAHNMAGVVCDGTAVCEGISMAYKFLCDLAGIPCIFVSGTLNGSPHAWNMVWIHNTPSFVDVTNDGSGSGRFDRTHFLRKSSEMAGYVWDRELIPEGRLTNKSSAYKTAHSREEVRKILSGLGKNETATVHLQFGYPLDRREIEQMLGMLCLTNPLLIARDISFAEESQMIFIRG